MFNEDFHGLDPRHDIDQARMGIAPSRHALSARRYLQDKRARLAAEADQRARIAAERSIATGGAWLRAMLNVARDLVRVVWFRLGARSV